MLDFTIHIIMEFPWGQYVITLEIWFHSATLLTFKEATESYLLQEWCVYSLHIFVHLMKY